MHQCYYSPDRCSFLTVECHKYGLSFISQLPGDHPFKFQVIRALQNLIKLIEGWNKVLFQILNTCGSGTLEMCYPHPVNSLDVRSSKIYLFFLKHAESSSHLSTRNWTANRVNFSETAKQGSTAEDSSPIAHSTVTPNPSWWRRTQGLRPQHISDQLIWQPQFQTSLCGFCSSLGEIKMIITLLSFDSHKIQLYNCSWQRHLLWFLQPKQQLMHLYNDVPYKTL